MKHTILTGTLDGPRIIGTIDATEARLVRTLLNNNYTVSTVISGVSAQFGATPAQVLVEHCWVSTDTLQAGSAWEWIDLTLSSVRDWMGY